jgi:hypothetical protein
VQPGNPLGLPRSIRCRDIRKWRFRIHQPRGGRIVRVTAYVNGRRVLRRRGHRITRIVIRRRPQRNFRLKIVAVTDNGARVISVRRYRKCRKGRPHTHVQRPHHHH